MKLRKNLNINPQWAYDLITGEILRNLPRKAIDKLTYLINSASCPKYLLDAQKKAEIILIPKSEKPPNKASSYRLLSLLSMLFEKLLLK